MIGFLIAPSAHAQLGQGRLGGTVTDAQGAVMPGVSVSVTSPALIGAQTTVSEANGRFLFPSLPSGSYTVTFELSGFQKLTRENIGVATGQTITTDVQLQLAGVSEAVTVTGASPIVDVTTTKVGTDLKGEELTAVPNSTDAWGALSEAPGVRMQGFDVGGSHKSQQSGYEVFGIQNQSRIVTDGVDHTEGVGGTGYYEDYYSNEEVSISALGSDVEMNSGGAAVVTTIKSGGNQFKGLENITYENGAWVGDNNTPALQAQGFTGNPNLLFYELHADLGGPIARDKAWFFVAYNTFKINKVVSGVPQNIATDVGLFHNYTGKGTWKPSKDDTVIGYIQRGRKEKPYRNLSALVAPESVLAQDSLTYTYKGQWQRVINNRTFLDVNVGNYHSLWPMVPAVPAATNIPTTQPSTGLINGAGWNAFNSVRNNPQVKAQMTYFLPDKKGTHDFKFGFEFRHDYYALGINGQSGPYRLSLNSAGVPTVIRFVDTGDPSQYGTGWTVAPNIDQKFAFYAQDRWAPNNRLTITAGLRVDHQNAEYGDSVRKPTITDVTADGTRIFPVSTTVSGGSLLEKATIAPRLGFSYDLTGKGQTVLKGFYGRYYNNLADGFSSANPGGTSYAAVRVQRPEPQQQVRRPAGTRPVGVPVGRRGRSGGQEREHPVHRRIQRIARTSVLGRVVGALHLRAEAQLRLHSVLLQPLRAGVVRQRDGAVASGGIERNGVQPGGHPGGPRLAKQRALHQHPGQLLHLRHDRVRLQQALQLEVLHAGERRLPVAQRAPLGGHLRPGFDQPAGDRPDRCRLLHEREPGGVQSPEDNDVSLPGDGTIHAAV